VKLVRTKELSFPEQLMALEDYLGRALPEALSVLYRNGTAKTLDLLPLATGGEHEPRDGDAEVFTDAAKRFASVLGHAMGNAQLAAAELDDHVWPRGLLTIEDVGCAIYRAVDLDDPDLRVVEYEHFDPVVDPLEAARGAPLAYGEPVVPRNVQHRFIVVAPSLDLWVRTKRAG
jgi:hypothetical protein